jgi:hypothetical protein
MLDFNPCHTPMEARLQLKESTTTVVDETEYHSVVGALRYLVHTRPDLAHSVGYVSWYMVESHEDHQAAVKRILRYIAGTLDHSVLYMRGDAEGLVLLDYNDSDHTSDIEDNYSTSGILFYLGRNPVSWQSRKQKSMALSSCVFGGSMLGDLVGWSSFRDSEFIIQATDVEGGQQSSDRPNQKPSSSWEEQAHPYMIPLCLRMCK